MLTQFIQSRSEFQGLNGQFWLTRFVFLRGLGFIYLVAFVSLSHQLIPLLGRNGLYPANQHLDRVIHHYGSTWVSFLQAPTLFLFESSDKFMYGLSLVGIGMSLLLLFGFANSILLFLLWCLYTSFVNIGQLFYGYGWEILLLETGFLAIFLPPLFRGNPLPVRVPPPVVVMWLYRWLLFRLMFGAGLIKLRGDACWTDLTCLNFHYETQPVPNPLSWYLHHMPEAVHRVEGFFSLLVELIVPWFVFGSRRFARVAGILLIAFQLMLIASGNLSWLNWLTILVCIPCLDDGFFKYFFPLKLLRRVTAIERPAFRWNARVMVLTALTLVIVGLSYAPVMNMISPNQIMNTSFDRLNVVNTYGAFGAVGKARNEIVLWGTLDHQITETTQWREYSFKCKPGNPFERPCWIAPYHYRLDWQMWFAAMTTYERSPWLIQFLVKLLQGDPAAASLLANNPFPDQPPRFLRADLYRYEFTSPDDDTGAWWTRRRLRTYLHPFALNDPGQNAYLRRAPR